MYHKWRTEARDRPQETISLILDGMDQAKTDVLGLNVRVVGCIVHGRPNKVYMFLVTHYTKETNGMVDILRRVLDAQETLPRRLVIQIDNTSQENKNSRMFTFLAQSVEKGVFDEIQVNFLPVSLFIRSFGLNTFAVCY